MNKVLKRVGIAAVILLIFALFRGCSQVSDEEILAARQAVANGAMIIDVRSEKEFNKEGHIEGAVNIPISYVDRMYNSIPRDKEIVVYCRTGSRSMVAARLLREQGWTVYDVATQSDWEREIKPKPEEKPAQ